MTFGGEATALPLREVARCSAAIMGEELGIRIACVAFKARV